MLQAAMSKKANDVKKETAETKAAVTPEVVASPAPVTADAPKVAVDVPSSTATPEAAKQETAAPATTQAAPVAIADAAAATTSSWLPFTSLFSRPSAEEIAKQEELKKQKEEAAKQEQLQKAREKYGEELAAKNVVRTPKEQKVAKLPSTRAYQNKPLTSLFECQIERAKQLQAAYVAQCKEASKQAEMVAYHYAITGIKPK